MISEEFVNYKEKSVSISNMRLIKFYTKNIDFLGILLTLSQFFFSRVCLL